jgi:hypothetical protein
VTTEDPPVSVVPPRAREPVIKWLLEGLLIVISVGLGFWVAQIGESRRDRDLAARVLAGLQVEVEHNIGLLEPMVPFHEQWLSRLSSADGSAGTQSGFDVFQSLRPPIPAPAESPFPILRRSAWDAAVSGGALRLIDYDLAAALSDIYRAQEIGAGNVDRLAAGVLASADSFDPARRAPTLRLLWLTLADITAAEKALLELGRKHLPALRAAAAVD